MEAFPLPCVPPSAVRARRIRWASECPAWTGGLLLEVSAGAVDSVLRHQAGLIYGVGALISLGFVLGLALLWWVLVGRQQRIVAERFRNLYQLIERQKRLLDSVNVSLDVGLFMADVTGQLQVGNRAFAEIVGREESELTGSNLASLLDGGATADFSTEFVEWPTPTRRPPLN